MTDILASDTIQISDYLATLRRRKWRIVLVGALILAVAVVAALFWPPTYRSSATILIEEPDVPGDLVKSTVSAFADERLQVIQQRVMTTQNLINVIDKFQLYPEQRRTQPINLIVDQMREKINLELVSADATDPKSGRTGKATIAFTLSFDDRYAQTTQQVANELVTLYLSENQRTRDEQASGTAGFLTGESQRLSDQIQKLEAQLAQFKAEHAGSLPEEFQVNTQLLDRAEGQLLETMRQMQALRERQAFLQSQLGQVDPYQRSNVTDISLMDPKDQLRSLQAQYAAQSAKFGTKHPDVINLKRQIDALTASAGGDAGRSVLDDQLKKSEADLAAALQKYGPEHPEVKKLKRVIEATKAQIAATPVKAQSSGGNPDNPAYIQLQAQLGGVNAEIDAARIQQEALQAKAKELEDRVFKSPEVERVYIALKRDYDGAVAKYEEIKAKESEADLAKSLESERMGEKLSVIEPPALPTQPIKPNRPLILVLGLFLAGAGGVGSGILSDTLGGRVYGARQLAMALGDTPLAVVPMIVTRRDRRRAFLVWVLAVLLVVAIGGAVALYLQVFVAPLDVLWTVLLNRFGM